MEGSALVGYRMWRIQTRERRPVLVPIHQREPWPSAELVATCVYGHAHRAPGPDCSCGIYATYSPELLETERHTVRGLRIAFGAIALDGEIVEFNDGYRAEYGRILRLHVPTALLGEDIEDELRADGDAPAIAAALGESYGVPSCSGRFSYEQLF